MAEANQTTNEEQRNTLNYWFDSYNVTDGARDALIKFEESLTADTIRMIADANVFDCDALDEDDEFIGTYIGDWEPYMDDLGVEDAGTQYEIMDVHQREAVHQLGMDRQQPLYMLVTEKNE